MATAPADDDGSDEYRKVRQHLSALTTERDIHTRRSLAEAMLVELNKIHADLTELFTAASARNLETSEIEDGLRDVEEIRAACVQATLDDE